MIELLMAFAVFWMVIGDLITYHQKVIFGVNFFDIHDPFTKPKSNDDGKTISFKQHKFADKSDTNLPLHPPGILVDNEQHQVFAFQRKIYLEFIFSYKISNLSSSALLRAPPSIS